MTAESRYSRTLAEIERRRAEWPESATHDYPRLLDMAAAVLKRHAPDPRHPIQVRRPAGHVGVDTYPSCSVCVDDNWPNEDYPEGVVWPCLDACVVLAVFDMLPDSQGSPT